MSTSAPGEQLKTRILNCSTISPLTDLIAKESNFPGLVSPAQVKLLIKDGVWRHLQF